MKRLGKLVFMESVMTKYVMGIDLGTSSVRAYLTGLEKGPSFVAGADYNVLIPGTGFAEQDPFLWYEKTVEVIRSVISQSGVNPEEIAGISFSGQMHGLVALDEHCQPVTQVILWLDQRSEDAIHEMYQILGEEMVQRNAQNRISPGFLLSSLYWLKKHRSQLYSRIAHVMLPKDYIKFRLCGRIVTDYSDAAGSLAFDNVRMIWSLPVIQGLGLDEHVFPECLPSTAVVGNIQPGAARDCGLSESTLVVNGGADQCMQSIGNGVIDEGVCASNIGTSALICTPLSRPLYDHALRTNTFAHVLPGKWSVMAACLNGGSVLKWLTQKILLIERYDVLDQMILAQEKPANDLFFLPYLAGERTPHMNPKARGVFFGLTLNHERADVLRAAMEGVVFGMKEGLAVLTEMGIRCDHLIAAGGGARSDVWLQMQADIFERDVYRSATKEQACLGAAITAAVGIGLYQNFEEACAACVEPASHVFSPKAENIKRYQEMYTLFRELYQVNVPVFEKISLLQR